MNELLPGFPAGPFWGGDSPAKNQLLCTDFIFIHPEPPTPRLLPPKVLQLPPKRWNPAGNPDCPKECHYTDEWITAC